MKEERRRKEGGRQIQVNVFHRSLVRCAASFAPEKVMTDNSSNFPREKRATGHPPAAHRRRAAKVVATDDQPARGLTFEIISAAESLVI